MRPRRHRHRKASNSDPWPFNVVSLTESNFVTCLIRIGSCGGLSTLPVASVVIPSASVSIRRNYDFDFVHATSKEDDDEAAYEISKPVRALRRRGMWIHYV